MGHVAVRVQKHPLFKRLGNDLVVTVSISLYEALLGLEREIVHLDGHVVQFRVPRGSVVRPGSVLSIEGEGMPLREVPSSAGRLLVLFEINFPRVIPVDAARKLELVLGSIGQGSGSASIGYGQS